MQSLQCNARLIETKPNYTQHNKEKDHSPMLQHWHGARAVHDPWNHLMALDRAGACLEIREMVQNLEWKARGSL